MELLKMVNGKCELTISAQPPEFSIGRSPKSVSYVIADALISRRHAVFTCTDSIWSVTDMSTNGMTVNGRKLKQGETVRLTCGDDLLLDPQGKFRYMFQTVDLPPPKRSKTDLDEQVAKLLEEKQQIENEKKAVEEQKNELEKRLEARENEQQHLSFQVEFLRSRLQQQVHDLTEEKTRIQEQLEGQLAVTCEERDNAVADMQQRMMDVELLLKEATSKQQVLEDQVALKEREKEQMSLEQLQQITASSSEFKQMMESELSCSICTEYFIDAVVLNCGHTFCQSCVSQWLRTQRICPMCRHVITSQARNVVLDSFIEATVQQLDQESRDHRQLVRTERAQSSSAGATGRGATASRDIDLPRGRGRGRGRGNRRMSRAARQMANYRDARAGLSPPQLPPPPFVRQAPPPFVRHTTPRGARAPPRGVVQRPTRPTRGAATVRVWLPAGVQPIPAAVRLQSARAAMQRTAAEHQLAAAGSRLAAAAADGDTQSPIVIDDNEGEDNVLSMVIAGAGGSGVESTASSEGSIATGPADTESADTSVSGVQTRSAAARSSSVDASAALSSGSSSVAAPEQLPLDVMEEPEFSRQLLEDLAAGSLDQLDTSSSQSDEDDDVGSGSDDSDLSDSFMPGYAYWGGYGRCFRCQQRGHWANGCPYY